MTRIHRRTRQKNGNNPDNHDRVVTHLEPDILECEVKWDLGTITMNKANRSDGILAELFNILKDDAVKVLHSIFQQSGKLSSGHRTGKVQFSFQSQRKVKVKVKQLCLTLCYPMDYTAHGILQARILGLAVFPFSRGSSQPRDQTWVSQMAGGFFTNWATREAQSQRRAMPKNVQTIIPLCSFYMLKRMLKILQTFSNMWMENFQIYRLGLQKAKEQNIKLPTFIRS